MSTTNYPNKVVSDMNLKTETETETEFEFIYWDHKSEWTCNFLETGHTALSSGIWPVYQNKPKAISAELFEYNFKVHL